MLPFGRQEPGQRGWIGCAGDVHHSHIDVCLTRRTTVSSMKKGLRRVGIVGLSTLVATTMMSGVASANTTFAFTRLQGVDRYATSVATAQQFGASTDVILASGESGHCPDALTRSEERRVGK